MPELPDVEVFRQYLESTSLHQEIQKTDIKDKSLLENVSARSLQMKLSGNELSSAYRHGKYLFVSTKKNGRLVLHFGMTGFLKYYKNPDQAPDHIRLLIHFSNDYKLAYDCQRKLGLISWTENFEQFCKEKKLGADPYNSDFKHDDLANLIEKSRGAIKSFLMNQEKIAGIGNIYSDEILFHAGIKPQTDLKNISREDIKKLYQKMNNVMQTAIDKKVNPGKFPLTYLLPNRADGKSCPICGGEIKKSTVSGRSSYYCPAHQK